MSDDNHAENIKKEGVQLTRWPFYTSIFLFCIIIAAYIFIFLDYDISSKPSDWGTFGDYIGGLANPIIALAVLFYVYKTFDLQRIELKATKAEFIRSRQEQEKQTKIMKIEVRINIFQTKNMLLLNNRDNCEKQLTELNELNEKLLKKKQVSKDSGDLKQVVTIEKFLKTNKNDFDKCGEMLNELVGELDSNQTKINQLSLELK